MNFFRLDLVRLAASVAVLTLMVTACVGEQSAGGEEETVQRWGHIHLDDPPASGALSVPTPGDERERAAPTASPSPPPVRTPPATAVPAPTPTPTALCLETAGGSVIVGETEYLLDESLCVAAHYEEAGAVTVQVVGGRSYASFEVDTGRQTAGAYYWDEVDLFEHFEPMTGPLPRSTPSPVPPGQLPR